LKSRRSGSGVSEQLPSGGSNPIDVEMLELSAAARDFFIRELAGGTGTPKVMRAAMLTRNGSPISPREGEKARLIELYSRSVPPP
jgi:hypothetical protein